MKIELTDECVFKCISKTALMTKTEIKNKVNEKNAKKKKKVW